MRAASTVRTWLKEYCTRTCTFPLPSFFPSSPAPPPPSPGFHSFPRPPLLPRALLLSSPFPTPSSFLTPAPPAPPAPPARPARPAPPSLRGSAVPGRRASSHSLSGGGARAVEGRGPERGDGGARRWCVWWGCSVSVFGSTPLRSLEDLERVEEGANESVRGEPDEGQPHRHRTAARGKTAGVNTRAAE
eukprot:3641753-Rhodomonas_salina.1